MNTAEENTSSLRKSLRNSKPYNISNNPPLSARPNPTDLPVLLTARCVRELTGLSESSIRRLRAKDSFPAPIRLTPGVAGHLRWIQSEILDWIESCRVRSR